MPGLDAERLKLHVPRGRRLRRRLWQEWCFLRALVRRSGLALTLLAACFAVGTVLAWTLGPTDGADVGPAAWSTWRLLLGELPEGMPVPTPLRMAAYILPIVGLLVVAEGFVEFVIMLGDRRRCERGWSEIMAASSKDHVVLVGLGKLGFRSWLLLEKLGETVVVIERDATSRFVEEVRRRGGAPLVGDGRSDDLLHAANVKAARSIILATNDDLANLEMALDARRVNPRIRVVLRLFDQNLANKVRAGFDIHVAMSQSAISAPVFAMAAHDPSIVKSFVIDDRLFVMQRWEIRKGGPLEGRSVSAISRELGFGIVQLVRAAGDVVLFPTDDLPLRPGDRLLVQAPFEALQALRDKGMVKELAVDPAKAPACEPAEMP